MANWIAISPSVHVHHRFIAHKDMSHAQKLSIVPVCFSELANLLPHYVLAFIPEGESFIPVVVLGVKPEINLYLSAENRWKAPYIPAALRGYPFHVASRDDGERVFCVQGDFISDTAEGEPLFNDEGQLAELPAKALSFLSQCEADKHRARDAADALSEAGVLQPWPLAIPKPDGAALKINGLYRVDEQMLNSLSAEAFQRLQGAPLSLSYAQLFSANQLPLLAQRFADYTPAPAEMDVEQLFGSEDDTLKFNF